MVQLPQHYRLKSGLSVVLAETSPADQPAVCSLLNTIITAGQTYPQTDPLSEANFAAYWLPGQSFVVRGDGEEPILAAFYLKPNFPGRCSHIANAGFIVAEAYRRMGLGRFMGEMALKLAPAYGYQALMFNLVFATNLPSVNLWLSLGFQIIGTIPQAVYLPDGRYTDALMFYRKLA